MSKRVGILTGCGKGIGLAIIKNLLSNNKDYCMYIHSTLSLFSVPLSFFSVSSIRYMGYCVQCNVIISNDIIRRVFILKQLITNYYTDIFITIIISIEFCLFFFNFIPNSFSSILFSFSLIFQWLFTLDVFDLKMWLQKLVLKHDFFSHFIIILLFP